MDGNLLHLAREAGCEKRRKVVIQHLLRVIFGLRHFFLSITAHKDSEFQTKPLPLLKIISRNGLKFWIYWNPLLIRLLASL
jgi:hypothetical protein